MGKVVPGPNFFLTGIGTKIFSRRDRDRDRNRLVPLMSTAVSHIPQFGDATKSPAGDAASPAGDVDVSAGDAHL
jgi:hypothetical protein